ncbi:MAG: YraN family protein [Thiotrichales bacterium]|nr:MAG: YraN family protein [Thiotrichales bacterium]
MSIKIGTSYEKLAAQFLITKGLKLLKTNYKTKIGEIDLIMQDGQTIVFVEVKYRKSSNYGSPAESVTYKKQHLLRQTALYYLQTNQLSDASCQFDVIGITDGATSGKNIQWIRNAF